MQDKKDTNKWVDTLAKDLESVGLLEDMLEEIEHLYMRQKLLGVAIAIQSATIFLIYMLLAY